MIRPRLCGCRDCHAPALGPLLALCPRCAAADCVVAGGRCRLADGYADQFDRVAGRGDYFGLTAVATALEVNHYDPDTSETTYWITWEGSRAPDAHGIESFRVTHRRRPQP